MRWFEPILLKRRPAWRWTLRLLAILLLAGIASYPWVLDRAGRAILARQGGHVESATADYSGFDWKGVEMAGTGWRLRVEALRIDSPLSWLRGDESGGAPVFHAQGVDLIIQPGEGPSDEPPLRVPEIVDLVTGILRPLEMWLPVSEIESIRVEWPGGAITVQRLEWRTGRALLERAQWEGDVLTLQGKQWTPALSILSLERWNPDHLHLQFSLPEGATVRAALAPSAGGETVATTLTADWVGGHLEGAATLASTGWWPTQAGTTGEATALPAQWSEAFSKWEPNVRWKADYDGAAARFSVVLGGSGVVPGEQPEVAPIPWKTEIEAKGDAERIAIEKLAVDVPFLQARLNRALLLDRATLRPAEAAELAWSLNLGASPVADFVSGEAEGALSLRPNAELTGARFSLTGTGRDIVISSGERRFDGKRLRLAVAGEANAEVIDAAELSLQVDEFGEVKGHARWDRAQGLAGPFVLEGRLESAGLARWVDPKVFSVPEGFTFSLSGEQEASGWKHAGAVQVPALMVNAVWPASAAVTWQGRDAAIDRWELELDRTAVHLAAQGSLSLFKGGGRVNLTGLSETRTEGGNWALAGPVILDWMAVPDSAQTRLTLAPFQLTREGGGSIEVEGQWSGWDALAMKARVRGVKPMDAAPWLEQTTIPELSATAVEIDLKTMGQGDGSFVWEGTGAIDATWISPRGRSWIGSGGWRLETERVVFDRFRLKTEETTWLHLQGTAPLSLRGEADSILSPKFDRAGAIDLLVELEPVDRLPQPLEERLPFNARALKGRLHATGTLAEPQAQLEVDAEQLNWPETATFDAIELRDLALRALIQDQRIDLQGLTLRLADTEKTQTISGGIGGIDWEQWLENPKIERWIELSGRLQLERWPVASLGRFLPVQLEPVGSVSIALEKRVGAWPEGAVRWQGLTSQPFGGGLVARQIAGAARLKGERLEDLQVSGTIGGQPWDLEGWIDVSEKAEPLFHLTLKADRLDLVRRPDLIIRGQAAIEAVRENPKKPARLRGELKMLRSLFLKDLQDFTRQGAAGVAQRPPYFSVEAEPFADWQLDLRLTGDEFLQIRSTVLTGQASVDFHLGGTLGTPLLTGEAWIDGGSMLFPFARLPATELRGRITAEEPHSVQLSGLGEGVAYGYIVQYQLTGTAEDPELIFRSVPSLPQDDILLMIATGAVPSSEITTNNTARAGRLALYLGQDIFSELFGQEGASRLEIRSGDGFSPFRRNGQVIEYELNDNWSVLGEYDDFGGYNVDFKRKLLKR